MPLAAYSGHWALAKPAQAATKLQQNLSALCQYLEDLEASKQLLAPLQLSAFRKDLQAGWYFASSIPGGYGAGSSGALCAAIYDRYGVAEGASEDLVHLKKVLAQIESFFHGASSGTDPLVSFLRRAVHLFSAEHLEEVDLPVRSGDDPFLFLLDTQKARKTEPLVQVFLKQCEDQDFVEQALKPLLQLNQEAIAAYRRGDWEILRSTYQQISQLQFDYFGNMIPEAFRKVWKKGLVDKKYYFKLCGAGGGGFILGIGKDWGEVKKTFGSQVQLLH